MKDVHTLLYRDIFCCSQALQSVTSTGTSLNPNLPGFKSIVFCRNMAVVGPQLVAYVCAVNASHPLLFFILATEIGLYFPRVALGGFFFGLVAGRVTVFWLQHVFNDALVEITITLASTYLTFYIGEEVLGISGVIAVVMLGIEINSLKTSISPEVEVFLHR